MSAEPFSTIGGGDTFDYPPSSNPTSRHGTSTPGGLWGHMLRAGLSLQRHGSGTPPPASAYDQDTPTSADSRQRMRSLLSIIQNEEAGSFPSTSTRRRHRASDHSTGRRTVPDSSTARRQTRRTRAPTRASETRSDRVNDVRTTIAELRAAGEELRQASENHERLLAMPIYSNGTRFDSKQDAERSDDGQARRKRRKLKHSPSIDRIYPKPYGFHGQAVPAPLRMRLVSCDGGQCNTGHSYDALAHRPENVLRRDKSVYCTRDNRCNMLFAHEGEIPFNLTKLIIKAPRVGYTHPLQQGLVFTSMERNPVFERTTSYKIRDITTSPFASYVHNQSVPGEKGYETSSKASTYSGDSGDDNEISSVPSYGQAFQQCEHESEDEECGMEDAEENEEGDANDLGRIHFPGESSSESADTNDILAELDDAEDQGHATLDPANLSLLRRLDPDSDVSSVTASLSDLTDVPAEDDIVGDLFRRREGFQDEHNYGAGLAAVLRQGNAAQADRARRRRMRDQRDHGLWAHLNTSRTSRSPSAPPAEGDLLVPRTHFRLLAKPRPRSDQYRPPTRNPNLDSLAMHASSSYRRHLEAAMYGVRTGDEPYENDEVASDSSGSTDSVAATHLYQDPNDEFDQWLASSRSGDSAIRRTIRGDGYSNTRVTSQLNKNGNRIEITFEPAISCRYLLLKLWQEEHVEPWSMDEEAGESQVPRTRRAIRVAATARDDDNIDIERVEAWGLAGHIWAPSQDIL